MARSVLITGCSTGIGYTCAVELHKLGYQVIATCRSNEDLAQFDSLGISAIQLDLNDSQSITYAVEQTLALCHGKIDVLFNNGAYGQAGALEDLPTQALREQFETNLFGWHELVKQVLPIMRAQGHGRIIQNSSVLGFAAMKYRGAYNASKFALEGWTDTLRLELLDTKIKVVLIQPGPIESNFRANALKKFMQWIDTERSVHKDNYVQQITRLEKVTSGNQFTLPSSAIMPPLLDAIESKRPKLRYRVTTPTKVFAVLKRILPHRLLDKILVKAA
ncbi:SDR family oxidoreductase [Vibrio sp. SCSIO 43136]|uniref:SDR family oxidoreductase n=1 Tax=Vibrio sp. SCSIO 43136 TaxID=2819101 RepID=UPI00207655DC|nr:SDR family oxidoreductase [Vibrio sp. SCSIO 43136]USD64580.1 SDR family oxidoreductase [Vibrio sp. SCSIO 43136]